MLVLEWKHSVFITVANTLLEAVFKVTPLKEVDLSTMDTLTNNHCLR